MELSEQIRIADLNKFSELLLKNDIGEAAEFYHKLGYKYQAEFNNILNLLGKYEEVMDQLDVITGEYDPAPPQE